MMFGVILLCTVLILVFIMAYKWMFSCQSKVYRFNSTDCVSDSSNINKAVDRDISFIDHRQYRASIAKWLFVLVCGCIWTSIPWEFMRLYQKAVAERASQIAQGAPPECKPEGMMLYESLKFLLRSLFSWTQIPDPCQSYYYSLHVDPLWEVSPLMVMTSLFTRTFQHLLEQTSSSLGHSLQMFFSHIPLQWQPVFMFFAVIASLLLLLMLCRYRLSVPLLLRIEPKSVFSIQSHADNRECQSWKSKFETSKDKDSFNFAARLPISTPSNFNSINTDPVTCERAESLRFYGQISESQKTSGHVSHQQRHFSQATCQISATSRSSSEMSRYHKPLRTLMSREVEWRTLMPRKTDNRALTPRQIDKSKTLVSRQTDKTKTLVSRQTDKSETLEKKCTSLDLVSVARKPAASKKRQQDRLWTPKSEIYEISDSD